MIQYVLIIWSLYITITSYILLVNIILSFTNAWLKYEKKIININNDDIRS